MSHKLTTDQMHRLTPQQFRASDKVPLIVVLDNIRSQNNIGSVFRTADAFRIQHIALCGICSTPPHRDIHKTALGAEDTVQWSYHPDTIQYLQQLKQQGYNLYAIEQVDDSIPLGQQGNILAGNKTAIIFGNELHGVQDQIIPLCDATLEIPQFGTKHSLNVSCAAAITLWELTKPILTNQSVNALMC